MTEPAPVSPPMPSAPSRALAIAAAVFGALAVACGAFGAHFLRGRLDDAALQIWHTAVQYQFWHVLAMLFAAGQARFVRAAGAFGAGLVLFCGSLYALALGAPSWVGILTPLGGLAFIAGWLALAVAFWRG